MSNSRHGWNWKGRLINCSEQGVCIQMGPTLRVQARDRCDLTLTVEDFQPSGPCHIANIRENAKGPVFRLPHDIADERTWQAYRQLLEVLALGSTLKLLGRTEEPDESGQRVENFVSDRPARLTIWRHPADRSLSAFEFQLKDNLVRATEGQLLEFLTGAGRCAGFFETLRDLIGRPRGETATQPGSCCGWATVSTPMPACGP